MLVPPEDGEFIIVTGDVGSTIDKVFSGINQGAVAASGAQGNGLRCVWGSAQRSDRASLGESRVPVFNMGPIEIETNLYSTANDAVNVNTEYPEGGHVTVIKATDALEGTAARLVLAPMPDTHEGWAVGIVTRSPAALPKSGVKIRVMLFTQPRYVPIHDAD